MIDLRKYISRNMRGNLMYAMSPLPDWLYLRVFYFATTGRVLNLKHPEGYTEKLQWLKLHEKHVEYRELVDKLAVREHIKQVLGEDYLFPLLGYWQTFDEIDFSRLPEQFVLKCNHDSGSTKMIRDKASLSAEDIRTLKRFYEKRLRRDAFYAGREYPYRGIKPYILAEPLMAEKNHEEESIKDYKFFCFNGIPKLMFVASDRHTNCCFDFFDMDFHHLDIENIHPNANKKIEKPERFEEMKQLAAKLSHGMKTVRIDLYQVNGKVYFGEYTFFHGGGFRPFIPEEWEKRCGDWIQIDR